MRESLTPWCDFGSLHTHTHSLIKVMNYVTLQCANALCEWRVSLIQCEIWKLVSMYQESITSSVREKNVNLNRQPCPRVKSTKYWVQHEGESNWAHTNANSIHSDTSSCLSLSLFTSLYEFSDYVNTIRVLKWAQHTAWSQGDAGRQRQQGARWRERLSPATLMKTVAGSNEWWWSGWLGTSTLSLMSKCHNIPSHNSCADHVYFKPPGGLVIHNSLVVCISVRLD